MIAAEDKPHSDKVVFVMLHTIEGEVATMHVFTTLRAATADALEVMMHEHPEGFAVPGRVEGDGEEGVEVEVEVKHERFHRATSLLRDIDARPGFVQVAAGADANVNANASSSSTGAGQEGGANNNSNNATTIDGPLLLLKDEDDDNMDRGPVWARFGPPRADYTNSGQLMLREGPDPIFVFSGTFRFVSNGLKMEIRRQDGAAVRVAVYTKNLRSKRVA
ncbi:hypothetical protein F4808DRAFT_441754 [Astrocystis sublimbata]|nr:hypothetical protein F4808DRAFT_446545 [Astrocystis sublimbata]KAI0193895.1 hypothetical protein F4808DRAFT_441754 [Astrocystis sublimbata]